jgi:hypothetical protein
MAQDATKVRVALTGKVWLGKSESVTMPANITAAVSSTDFDDLGFTTEDGVTFTFGKNVTDIMGWQSSDPLRKLLTAEPKSVEFVLRQMERATFLSAFGGTITGTDPNFEWAPPAPGTLAVRPLIVEFTDDDIDYRFIYRRCSDEAEKKVQLLRTDAVNLPANYAVLAASPNAWIVQTNDSAMTPEESSSSSSSSSS